jgi:uncharacterized protein YkwD
VRGTQRQLQAVIADKPFLIACLGLFIILCFYYYRGHREIMVRPNAEERILEEVNKLRDAKGLENLTDDWRITEVARRHSLNMASGITKLGHFDSKQRFAMIAESGINWIAAAENVACVNRIDDPALEAFHNWTLRGWHLQNMKGNFDRTGIGVVQNRSKGDYYITQIYVKTLMPQ